MARMKSSLDKEIFFVFIMFLVALAIRMFCVFQMSHIPFYSNPIGDSEEYYRRALEIVNGKFIGDKVWFYGSPLYPYLMAMLLAVSKGGVSFAYRVQALLGAVNCVLIYFLAKKVNHGKVLPSLLSGFLACLYGYLVFLECVFLAESIVLVFLTSFFLLFLGYFETNSRSRLILAGMTYGIVSLLRPHALLFMPLAVVMVLTGFKIRAASYKVKQAAWFAFAFFLAVLPITARNYLATGDLYLVSPTSGLNFYIGNNEFSRGMFYLPPGSGLGNRDLLNSATRVAQRNAGKTLSIRQIDDYWFDKGLGFVVKHPLREARLVLLKIKHVLNRYEIPNVYNFYFFRESGVSVLKIAIVGFWLIAPLGLLGMFGSLREGNSAARLLAVFSLAYLVSLLPFFITARYRVPIVVPLLCFAGKGVSDLVTQIRRKGKRALLASGLVYGVASALVFLPQDRISYERLRNELGAIQLMLANSDERDAKKQLESAIINFKWVLENEPENADVHFNLGLAYETIGFLSGSIEQYNMALKDLEGSSIVNPKIVKGFIENSLKKYNSYGDRYPQAAMPKTPYESAAIQVLQNQRAQATATLKDLLRQDPFHAKARVLLAEIG